MIKRWELGKVVGMFKTRNGDWVKYADHKAIVNELVEVMETSEALLNDVRRRYPEIETNGFSCPFFRAIEQAIKKVKEVS